MNTPCFFIAVTLLASFSVPRPAHAQLDLLERNQKAGVKGLSDQMSLMEWSPASHTWRVATGVSASYGTASSHYWRFHGMIEQAEKLAKSQVGAGYEKQVLPSLTSGLAASVAKCAVHASGMEPFSVVYVIQADGGVSAVILNRPIWKCSVEGSQIPARVAPPPHAPWLVVAKIKR